MQALKSIELKLFYLVNHLKLPIELESLMVTITTLDRNQTFLFVALPVFLGLWGFYERRRAAKAFLALAIVVGSTDLICNRLIKKTVDRTRPNLEASLDVRLRLPYSPKGESFVSNHSANTFSAATLLTAYYPGYRIAYFAYASLIAFTRPYVGVHYVSDVLAGGVMGWLIAFLYLRFWFQGRSWFEIRRQKVSARETTVPNPRESP